MTPVLVDCSAQAMATIRALLTRDETRYRAYFPRLQLITPTTD